MREGCLPNANKGMVVLIVSVLIQICLGGSMYGWSAYVPALRQAFAFSAFQTNVIFGCTVAFFVFATILGGKWQESWGPRRVALLGSFFYYSGYLLAAFSQGNFYAIFIGIALFSGIAAGLGFVCVMATVPKWFTRNKGFILGVALAGYGGGCAVMANYVQRLFSFDFEILQVFTIVGLSVGSIYFVSSLFLTCPEIECPHAKQASQQPYVFTEYSTLIPLFLGMFTGTFGGLIVSGNLVPIGLNAHFSQEMAVQAITFFAIGNTFGRMMWGHISDKIGWKSIPLCLFMQALSVACLLFPMPLYAFYATTFLVGLQYGGNFVLAPAYLTKRFDDRAVGRLYPLILVGFGIAGFIGPTVGGRIHDIYSTFSYAFVLSVGVALIGTFVTLCMLREKQPKLIQG